MFGAEVSRSYRKTPMCGWTASMSEKRDKAISHRKFRRTTKQAVEHEDPDAASLPEKQRDVVNPWNMDKEGKHRFDPDKWPKGMRK